MSLWTIGSAQEKLAFSIDAFLKRLTPTQPCRRRCLFGQARPAVRMATDATVELEMKHFLGAPS